MNRQSAAAIGLFGFICGIGFWGALESRRGPERAALAQEPRSGPTAGEPNAGNPDGEPETAAEKKRDEEIARLTVKSAKTYLKLAQLNLQTAQSYNQSVPGSFSQAEVDRLQRLVTLAQSRLNWAEKHGNQADANRLSAELAVQSAEVAYRKNLATNNQLPGAISPVALEKTRLTLELAQLNLAKAGLVDQTGSRWESMQWQIDQVREDMLLLRSQLDAITSRR